MEFWDVTLRELYREFAIGKRRLEDRITEQTSLAWTIESLHRAKRLPSLETLLTKRRKQTAKEMGAKLREISQHFNIPLRKATKRGH